MSNACVSTLLLYAIRESMGIFKAIASKSSTWAAISLLGLLLACYANSFHGAWQYDDFVNIVNNGKIHMTEISWPQIRKVLSAGPDFQIVGRPLAYLSFALNYLWGLDNPMGYHVVNFGIHYLAALILFLFVRDTLRLPIFDSRYTAQATLIAWLATLFWGCHPIHVTAVTYIVQRMTAMAGLFYIVAMYAYLIGRRSERTSTRVWSYGMCALSTICGLLTKENAVLLPYAILLYELLFFRTLDRRTVLKIVSAVLGVTAVLLLLSVLYTNPLRLFEPYTNRPFTMTERLLTQPRALFIYLGMLAVPMASRMSILHDIAISESLATPWTTGIAILGLLAILLFLCMLARRHRLFAYCGLFFFLNHAVESSILNLELIYEHRNYVPSMLLFVPLGVGVARAMSLFYYQRALRVMIFGCAGLLLLTRAQTTFEYNRTFASEYDLWRHVTLIYPNSSLAFNNLGKAYWYLGQPEKSCQSFLKAVELDNFNNTQQKGLAFYNLGLHAAKVEKNYLKALEWFEDARALLELSKVWHEEAQVRMQMADFAGAEDILKGGLKRWPDDPLLNGLMAINKLKMGEYAEAAKIATTALAANRIEDRIASMVIAQSHWLQKDYPAALEDWQHLLEKKPEDIVALLALAEMHEKLNQREMAVRYMQALLDLKGIDYIQNHVVFEVESENIMPYVPNEKIINALVRDITGKTKKDF